MNITAKYKVNGFYYDVERVNGDLVYLKIGKETFPVRLEDVEDMG